MKIKITLKDPDGVYDAIQSAAEESVKLVDGLSLDEAEQLCEQRRASFGEACGKWVKWGEYVSITIDTNSKTATVDTVIP